MIKRFLQSITIALLVALSIHSAHAVDESQLPDIGTAGVAALPIDREVTYGNSFMRFARAQLPIIDDPVLNEYLTDLGQRLVSHANDIRFPFTFFLVQDQSINAAAFLGGKVKVHS
ncbi:MAG: M48 family peptidase, partial [Aeromonadaceae bacterium]